MSANIRYPNITGVTEAAQLQQMRSYLHQLVDQLNMTLEDGGASTQSTSIANVTTSSVAKTEQDPVETFNSIKALIIKSADIVDAYYEETSYRMQSAYVAQSAFGEYVEKTDKVVVETADATKELYTNVQNISSNVAGIQEQLRETDGYIKRGIIDYADDGSAVIGIEIGQTRENDGNEVFEKYARFTAERLEFYDAMDQKNPVAYVSGSKLYITTVQVLDIFLLGGFKDDAQVDGSVVTRWVGV